MRTRRPQSKAKALLFGRMGLYLRVEEIENLKKGTDKKTVRHVNFTGGAREGHAFVPQVESWI
jgi:hypothetical protein